MSPNPEMPVDGELFKDHQNYWLIIANRTKTPLGGVVLRYSENCFEGLEEATASLDQNPEANGCLNLVYVVPSRGLGVVRVREM
jgi:hypothetical protein